MGNLNDIWVVIPSFNEAAVIRSTVENVLKRQVTVVVVDDGSTDETEEILSTLPVWFLRHPINLGQGAALQTGIRFAVSLKAQEIVTFDADGQHDPGDIVRLVEMRRQHQVDVVLGSRFLPGAKIENMPMIKRWVLGMAILFTRLTTGLKLTDTHNGFRVLSGSAARSLHLQQAGMAHASEFLSEIRRNHFSYLEVAVTVLYTDYSIAKGQKLSNGFNILFDLLKGWLLR